MRYVDSRGTAVRPGDILLTASRRAVYAFRLDPDGDGYVLGENVVPDDEVAWGERDFGDECKPWPLRMTARMRVIGHEAEGPVGWIESQEDVNEAARAILVAGAIGGGGLTR